ncbi:MULTISPECIES: hypothetical protein [Halorussus]|uniref:hypothetical protein n=1 Tax=Halorussus TaxID=1070314 RepID=UPI000E20F380|nr:MULTISPECIES: hypothetical protein [Halorussus]NHN58653.1 hypothetical protein [Halorussus sp. JP-T4]
MPTRRRLLAVLPSVAFAGCLGRTAGPGGSDTAATDFDGTTTDPATTTALPEDLVRRNGRTVVDFPGTSDGEVSVSASEGVTGVTFSDAADADFELTAVADGNVVVGEGRLAASRTLTPADEPRAFVAPVYRNDEGFEFRAYANTAFREMGTLHLLAAPGRSLVGDDAVSRPAGFESITGNVGRTTISAADVEGAEAGAPLSVALVDASLESLRSGNGSTASGVVLQHTREVREPSPKAVFRFEFGDGSVTVTHHGGDSIAGGNLAVRIGDEPTGAAFPEEVTAGDSVSVDLSGVEAGTSVRAVWTAPEGDRSAVLAKTTVPSDETTTVG